MEPKSTNLGGVLILVLLLTGAVLLVYKAPCLYDGAPGLSQAAGDVSYCHMVEDARVTVIDAVREPKSPRWIYTCSCAGRRIVLAMPGHTSRNRPVLLRSGRTYRLDYYRADGLETGGITRVRGEVSESAD